jgi:hypothetical protein
MKSKEKSCREYLIGNQQAIMVFIILFICILLFVGCAKTHKTVRAVAMDVDVFTFEVDVGVTGWDWTWVETLGDSAAIVYYEVELDGEVIVDHFILEIEFLCADSNSCQVEVWGPATSVKDYLENTVAEPIMPGTTCALVACATLPSRPLRVKKARWRCEEVEGKDI